jgi:hypothetical protein
MTSFAFILGVVPLVRASGAGAEMRQALGTAVFFGMLGVTFFGLFLTPVFYVTIKWITGHFGGPRRGPAEPPPPVAGLRPPPVRVEVIEAGHDGHDGHDGHAAEPSPAPA